MTATLRNPEGRATLGYLLVGTAAASWGTWPLILRRAESIAPIDPALESLVMLSVITLVTGPLALKDRVRVRASAKDWGGIAWLGFGDAMNDWLFFAAYQTTSVAVAVITHYLAPVLVAIGAPLILKEVPGPKTMSAVVVSFVGLVLLLAPWQAERHASDWWGAALGAGSAVFYASNVFTNKRLARVFSGSEMMFFHGLVAVPIIACAVPAASFRSVDLQALGVVAAGALGPGALGGLFFVWGLRCIPASHASTLTLLEPLVAVLLATVALHQSLGMHVVIGAALVLWGARLVIVVGTRKVNARDRRNPDRDAVG